jgi:L-fuculose-phosphate aldolase
MTESELREQMCEIGRRLYHRGYVSANKGNLSVRLNADEVLCTPTLISKGFMRPDDLATVDMDGKQKSGVRSRTSEIKLHLSIYRHRPNVHAVIHTHAPHVTAFAITGEKIPQNIHPEMEFFVGPVPTAPYRTPGTQEFADSVVPYLDQTRAIVLSNHGLVAFGSTLEEAWFVTEIVESYCRLLTTAKNVGLVQQLSIGQMMELQMMKKTWKTAEPNAKPID